MIEMSLQSEPVALQNRPFGRRLRSVAAYGVVTGVMTTVQLLIFIPAVLFDCVWRNGRRAGWIAAVLGAGLAALATMHFGTLAKFTPQEMNVGYASVLSVALTLALPALLVERLLERKVSFGYALVVAVAVAVVGMCATELAMRSLASFSPLAALKGMSGELLPDLPGVSSSLEALLRRWMLATIPASVLMQTATAFIFSIVLFARLTTWRESMARREPVAYSGPYLFRNLALPEWMLFAFIAGGLTPLATGLLQTIAANVLVIVSFLYLVQGLAIFRFLLVALGAGVFGSIAAWMALGLLALTSVGFLLLAVAGLFDSFFDFRHFKKRKDDSHESHSD